MLVSSLWYVIVRDALMTSQGLLRFYSIFAEARPLRWHCLWLLALFQISYLFNSHGWPPILFFIQKRQTYCSWWIYIRVKDWRFKFTWKSKRYTVLLSIHFLIISHWNSLLYDVTIKCLIRSLHFCRVWARASFSYFHNNFFSVHVQFGCAGRIQLLLLLLLFLRSFEIDLLCNALRSTNFCY